MNEGSYIIRGATRNCLQREQSDGRDWFGAKATARRFLTRGKAETFILKVLGHSHDLAVVHLLPKGTIARRERRSVREAIARAVERYDAAPSAKGFRTGV